MSCRFLTLIPVLLLLGACSEHKVDTFPEWCEQITGVDLYEQYAPFWAIFPSVSFHAEEIRDDVASSLNAMFMEKVENRSDRMVWREGTELHMINLSSLLVIESEKIIGSWRDGIEKAKRYEHKNEKEVCLYGTVTSMFDSMHIHSMTADALGVKWTDDVTVIDTERKGRLKNPL